MAPATGRGVPASVEVNEVNWAEVLDDIISNARLEAYYQPIVDMRTCEMIGVEALSRFPQLPGIPVDEIFRQSRHHGRQVDLDMVAICVALEGMSQLPDGVHMALNVSAESLASARLPALISHNVAREQIVLEVTEHSKITDFLPLYKPLHDFRERMVKLAMNDVGAGFAGLANLVNLRPDIIKIDRFLIDNINAFPGKRDMVEAILSIARNMRSIVVAEGVETQKEIDWLQAIGLRFGQGFFWAKPSPQIPQNLLINPGVLLRGG